MKHPIRFFGHPAVAEVLGAILSPNPFGDIYHFDLYFFPKFPLEPIFLACALVRPTYHSTA